MTNARLDLIALTRFKSYRGETSIELSPLTILLGRNNSGKSTIIQALLLLKQTLAHPRSDVPLHLEGLVDALSLRELTFGWPRRGESVGPAITLRWSSVVDVRSALERANNPDMKTFSEMSGISWLMRDVPDTKEVSTELKLSFGDLDGRAIISRIDVASFRSVSSKAATHFFTLRRLSDGRFDCKWAGRATRKLQVELEHFIPYLQIDRRNVGPRSRERSWHNAFLLLFAQPLEDLKSLISGFSYLGSIRSLPPTLYRPMTVPPDDIGVSGEYGAQMLHARKTELVHYLPPLRVDSKGVKVPKTIRARPLVEGVNDVLKGLGVDATLSIDEIKDVGFRLLFGQASLQHVGRGLSYLLPVIELGLVADPLRFTASELDGASVEDYLAECRSVAHCAFEEPEAHLHPKVQTRLAHWLVALAMSGRQLIVETHSDHLVRRLRGLVARSQKGSKLELWLLRNVRVIEVEQADGCSVVQCSTLTERGGIGEHWPVEFMDEAVDEERSIFNASLDKGEESAGDSPQFIVDHDIGDEP